MPILGINNRTENWKTAYEFAPFFRDGNACTRLARTLDEGESPTGNEVKIELFWKGMRDYVDKVGKDNEDAFKIKCAKKYKELFSPLRSEIEEFNEGSPRNSLRLVNDINYDPSQETGEKGLWDNLYNTEIDIVLETPNNLFIGEAKGEMGLGTGGKNVLVHQLIRQFVMANILLHLMGKETKKVVPFLVVADDDHIKKTGQVRFMIEHRDNWLKEKNVLTWAYIRTLQP